MGRGGAIIAGRAGRASTTKPERMELLSPCVWRQAIPSGTSKHEEEDADVPSVGGTYVSREIDFRSPDDAGQGRPAYMEKERARDDDEDGS